MFLARYATLRDAGAREPGAKVIVAGVARMGRVSGSWLDGPGAPLREDGETATYPGQRLGLPGSGRNSAAGFGRRFAALVVDWLICLLVAGALTRHRAFDGRHPVAAEWPLAILALEYVVLLTLVGSTVGMRLDGRRLPLRWAAVRTLLLLLVIPAVVYDRDQRGLHDRASDAVAVRI
jgi:hypothetical protein